MNVAIVDIITRDWLKHHVQPDVIIYRKLAEPVLLQEYPAIRWVDYSANLTSAIRFGYLKVRAQLEKIREERPDYFETGGYHFFEALNKDLFWAMFDELLADHSLSQLGPDVRVVYDYRHTSPARGWIRLLKWISGMLAYVVRLRRSSLPPLSAAGRIAIRMNNPDLVPMLGKLPEVLGSEKIVYYASDHLRFMEKLHAMNVTDLTSAAPFSPGALLRRFRGAIRFSGISGAPVFLAKYTALQQMVTRYEYLCKSGVKAILVNACENDGEGNILSQVAQKHGVKAANFMNGIKAFDIMNQHTEFDLWFMHDEKMQDIAATVYGIDRSKLPVTGHLLRDVAMCHRYTGLLDRYFTNGKPRFIIAFFTSPLFFGENTVVYQTLQRFLDGRSDAMVFVKPHPLDKEFLWDRDDPRIVRLDFRQEKVSSETALFDLLSESDVSISIASTVSFQASWFRIPSISFELTEQSRLPYTDGIYIRHVNNAEKLLEVLESSYVSSLRKKNNPEASSGKYPVAEKAAALLEL